ncbi:unnamed protein product [Haemonchus placei]|uniref:Uncharacterized protein n=1 Tax=Haemonchus placei TaxID=6290 RepID=A0A0N4WRS0_HAEPC|nr:unnamed protein product [Haemonchus placei]
MHPMQLKLKLPLILYGGKPNNQTTTARLSQEMCKATEAAILWPCSRKLKFVIPKKFIHNGNPRPEQWLDIGSINLEGAFDQETRECMN